MIVNDHHSPSVGEAQDESVLECAAGVFDITRGEQRHQMLQASLHAVTNCRAVDEEHGPSQGED